MQLRKALDGTLLISNHTSQMQSGSTANDEHSSWFNNPYRERIEFTI